jgi:hypothetical protein
MDDHKAQPPSLEIAAPTPNWPFCSHLAVNSSKLSSAWSSDRRRALVLKLLAASRLGTTRPARATSGAWERTTMVLARKKVLVEPRAATRRREEADIVFEIGWVERGDVN